RVLTIEQCLERALKRVVLLPEKESEAPYREGNARLLAWLVNAKRKEKLETYPLVCAVGTSKLKSQERLLWPVTLWTDTAVPFADVFGGERRFADLYSEYLSKEQWDYLEEEGFILKSVFRKEGLGSLDPAQVRDALGEEAEHKPVAEIDISDIAFL